MIKYRAIISGEPHYFTLQEIVYNAITIIQEKELGDAEAFDNWFIKDTIIPWIAKGNKPDRFTGIQDIYNKGIYENDVVVVEYLAHIFQVKHNNTNFILVDESGSIYSILDSSCREEIVAVVGNIHQNPELIEEKTIK